ncbi:MAG: hypothetical protein LBM99_06125, partial [Bacillales bacterium]|nr:hypothetical protein [Bacillales bacterium]
MKLKSLLLTTFLLVTGCSIRQFPVKDSSSDTSTDSSSVSVISSASVPVVEDYASWVDSWSEEGHLYIHYKRLSANALEYNEWAIWIWQNAPYDLEGAIYCASDPAVQDIYHPMTDSWMTNIGASGSDFEPNGGRVADIDLKADIISGKSGKSVSFEGATKVGFLIPRQDSMDGSSHWISDGGANTYIYDFQDHFRENGSMHIYVQQGSVGDFSFGDSDVPIPSNPTVNDTTGAYVSENELMDVSSTDAYPNSIPETSQSFYNEAGIGYQIFVPSFADSNGDGLGDIRGIINSLDYLEELNVNALWLTPIQESESYHGYDITDFYKIDSKFGTEEDYLELLTTAHSKGIKIVMDFVVNHTSKNNIWFKKSQRASVEDNKEYRNMYHWRFKGDLVPKCTVFGEEYATWGMVKVENHSDWYRDGESDYYYFAKFGSGMAELNYDSQLTRDLVVEMANYWLDFGVDGLRLDAVKHIYMRDESQKPSTDNGDRATSNIVVDTGYRTFYDEELMKEETVSYDYSTDKLKNINFWKEFSFKVKEDHPNAYLVGENFDGWDQRVSPYYKALDSQFDFGLYYHNL